MLVIRYIAITNVNIMVLIDNEMKFIYFMILSTTKREFSNSKKYTYSKIRIYDKT